LPEGVTQNSILLYRRFVIRNAPEFPQARLFPIVEQTAKRPSLGKFPCAMSDLRPADCKSAIQQIKNLRYFQLPALLSASCGFTHQPITLFEFKITSPLEV